MIKNIDITVTRAYRDAILAEYPLMNSRKGYWAMFQYLQFGTFKDKNTSDLVLSAATCASFEEKPYDQHYAAHKFISAFSKDIAPICYNSISNAVTHKANTASGASWSDKVVELTLNERRKTVTEDRVWLVSGNKYRPDHASAIRKACQTEALAEMEYKGCREAFDLLTYINNLNNNTFSKILKNIDDARELAIALDQDTENQLNIIMQIATVQQPFYHAVDKTTRIYAMSSTFLGLKREVRAVITRDWIQCDLASAQLAILAKIWNLPAVEAYLKAGKKIWPDLCACACLAYNDDNKAIMKSTLYGISFGSKGTSIEEDFDEAFGAGCGKKIWARLKKHEVIAEMLAAREVQRGIIRSQGYALDAFGSKVFFAEEQVPGKPYKKNNLKSILSCVAQSYELLLLYPVVQYAREHQDEVQIQCWLHDGFSIEVRHAGHREAVVNKLKKLVASKAAELGMCTELEISGL